MTFILVCALCTTTSGSLAPALASEPFLRLSAERDGTPDLNPGALLRPALLLNEAAHSDGGSEHGASHMGPMWIVMGIMMVAMMATVGFYMMRNATASSVPAAEALPVAPGASALGVVRFGGG